MKKRNKRMSIILLLIMIVNFISVNIIPTVNALTSGEVFNYKNTISTNINGLKGKITTSKSDTKYETDNAYKEAVLYLEELIGKEENSLIDKEAILDLGISLESLITDCFPSKLTIYETYFTWDQLIDVDNIVDITYIYYDALDTEKQNPLAGTLLTKSEIEEAIKEYYLSSINSKVLGYVTDYDTLLANYQVDYNDVIAKINTKVGELNTKKSEIETFVTNEEALGNAPVMLVESLNIYDLITTSINELENLKESLTIKNLSEKETEITNIYNGITNKINTFYTNNGNYIEIELDKDITDFENSITSIETNLTNWFTNLDDYKNSNISNYVDSVDADLINIFKDIITLEEDYDILLKDVNKYLERKVSDKTSIDTLMTNITAKRAYINKEKALSDLELIVDNANLTDEDVVDILLPIKDITGISNETKTKLSDAKLSFYDLDLIDSSNYQMIIDGDYLILENVRTSILVTDFTNNLDYDSYKKEVKEQTTNVTNNTVVDTYDRDDKLLKTYKVLIKGDLNNDGVYSLLDIEQLNKIVLEEQNITDEVLLKSDLNNDEKVDLSDLVLIDMEFDDTITSISNGTDASLKIIKEEKEDLMCYNIKLQTNGTIRGIKFDLSFTDNLVFEGLLLNNNIEFNEKSENLVHGVGINNYINDDDIVTVCFSEDETKDLTTKTFRLSNIELVFDNSNTKKITELVSTTVTVENVEGSSNNVTNTNNSVETNNSYEETKEETTSPKDEEENKVEEIIVEEEKEEILWGNVIKIIIVVLLGAVIIYYLNKNETEEEPFKEDDNKKDSN